MDLVDETLFERLVEIRRDLHRHPELSWQETRTASQICAFLDELGIAYRNKVGGTGVLAEIPGATDAPSIALRADIDALPIFEETGLPFASEVDGVMHACGHDGHISMLLEAAALLAREPVLPAPVRLIFQPAEEVGRGAPAMIKAGSLDGVGMIFSGHLDRHYPTGTVIVTDGPVNAASDRFSIEIRGSGGHAARPHETVDAVVVGSLLVMAIQTIVSREVNPAHPSVISVGRFDAGTAGNVIAGHARLQGTIRTQDPEVRDYLHGSLQRITESVGRLHGAEIELQLVEGVPVLMNTPDMAELARRAAARTVGQMNVRSLDTANMGGEDFSCYLEEIPGCYVRFGARGEDMEGYPTHSSRFDFDEKALAVGAAYYRTIAKEAGRLMASNKEGGSDSNAVAK
jgi:hippurate hydrolase